LEHVADPTKWVHACQAPLTQVEVPEQIESGPVHPFARVFDAATPAALSMKPSRLSSQPLQTSASAQVGFWERQSSVHQSATAIGWHGLQ
jgi:hypothetical protein